MFFEKRLTFRNAEIPNPTPNKEVIPKDYLLWRKNPPNIPGYNEALAQVSAEVVVDSEKDPPIRVVKALELTGVSPIEARKILRDGTNPYVKALLSFLKNLDKRAKIDEEKSRQNEILIFVLNNTEIRIPMPMSVLVNWQKKVWPSLKQYQEKHDMVFDYAVMLGRATTRVVGALSNGEVPDAWDIYRMERELELLERTKRPKFDEERGAKYQERLERDTNYRKTEAAKKEFYPGLEAEIDERLGFASTEDIKNWVPDQVRDFKDTAQNVLGELASKDTRLESLHNNALLNLEMIEYYFNTGFPSSGVKTWHDFHGEVFRNLITTPEEAGDYKLAALGDIYWEVISKYITTIDALSGDNIKKDFQNSSQANGQ